MLSPRERFLLLLYLFVDQKKLVEFALVEDACVGREDFHHATIAVFEEVLDETGWKDGGGY